ncbi:hypothetical protein [Cohnella panacarvi]|uniref:hypothetical protein n=1 Tax=Cohnella panacarvi TaxID=400776 RepID=UPI00047CD3F7|nr:hypothetical protein [Cohnella panacarvi]
MLQTVRYKFGKLAMAFMVAASLLVSAIPASAEISGATYISNLKVAFADAAHTQIVATSKAISTRPNRKIMEMTNYLQSLDTGELVDSKFISDLDKDGIIDWTSNRHRADIGYRLISGIVVFYSNGVNDFFVRDYFWDPKHQMEPKVSEPFKYSESSNPTKAYGYFEYANASKTKVVAKVAASTTRTDYEFIDFRADVIDKGIGRTDGIAFVFPKGISWIEWESLMHNGNNEIDLEYSFSLRLKDGSYEEVTDARKWRPLTRNTPDSVLKPLEVPFVLKGIQ